MKNFIFKALSAGLFALVAFVPAFVNAEAPATGGSSSSADSAPSTSSSSTSASAGAPSTGESSSTAVATNAPSTGSSATSAGTSGTDSTAGAPSTGSSATSAGTGSNDGSNGGSNNGGSNSGGSRSRGGQGGLIQIALTNVQIEMTAAGLKVSWESTPNTEGRVIYGATSVPTLVTSESNFGYTASTALSGSTDTHSVIVPAQLGSVVYLRVMGQNNNRVEFGSEIAVTVPARLINSPAVSSPVDTSVTAPSRGGTEVNGNVELDLSKNGKSPLVANPAETTLAQKIGGFFKKIWTAIVSVFR